MDEKDYQNIDNCWNLIGIWGLVILDSLLWVLFGSFHEFFFFFFNDHCLHWTSPNYRELHFPHLEISLPVLSKIKI